MSGRRQTTQRMSVMAYERWTRGSVGVGAVSRVKLEGRTNCMERPRRWSTRKGFAFKNTSFSLHAPLTAHNGRCHGNGLRPRRLAKDGRRHGNGLRCRCERR